MVEQKKKKEKPSYTTWQNLRYIMSYTWKNDKLLAFFNFICIPLIIIQPLLRIYLASHVVKLVTDKTNYGMIIAHIIIISVILWIMNALNNILQGKTITHSILSRFQFIGFLSEKSMDTDYENIESEKGRNIFSKAWNLLDGNNTAPAEAIAISVRILTNLFGLISYAAILSALHPLIILIVVITSVAGYYASKLYNIWEFRNRGNWTPIDRKINYLRMQSNNFSSAKDIRLYGMHHWFSNIFDKILRERKVWYKKSANRLFAVESANNLLNFIQGFAAYGFLVYLLFRDNMPVENFVLYFGIIGGFSSWLSGLIDNWSALNRHSFGVCDIRSALDIPDKFNKDKGISVPMETCGIEFRNVSFGYTPEKKIIQNLSFTICKGEKIAVVGANGAGKTTLIKLLCGFYMPDEGEILINGKNIKEYNIKEYYNMFAAVFQEINFLPVKINQNITCTAEDITDTDRILKFIELAGLKNKINSLPNGINSQMGKSIYNDAIDLSGGEIQKLALARALYKGGKILILDEPTAALDPIAESELYEQYNDMSDGKTSVFISHRLASTKFCNRIFFVENGTIAEMGSHDELMAIGGKYSEMFEIQSHYYKENKNDLKEEKNAV